MNNLHLRKWEQSECIIPPPVLTDIVKEYSVEPWCEEYAQWLLCVASPFNIAAALGMLGRFWRPKDGKVQEALEEAMAGASPGHRAKEWWSSLPQEARRQVVDAALMRVDDLMDSLPCLGGQIDKFALEFILHRDNLESVLFLMNGTPEADALRGALRDLDHEASPLYAAWAPALKDDDRLCAVAAEPGAWWPNGAE